MDDEGKKDLWDWKRKPFVIYAFTIMLVFLFILTGISSGYQAQLMAASQNENNGGLDASPSSSRVSKVGAFEAICHLVEVRHPLAYLATVEGFQIINIANPKQPTLIATHKHKELLAVHPTKPVVFILEGEEDTNASLALYNASDPSDLVLLSNYYPGQEDEVFLSYRSITVTETSCYFRTPTHVNLIDITNLSQPTKLGSWSSEESILEIIAADFWLYTKTEETFLVLDFEDSAHPQKVGETNCSGSMSRMDFAAGLVGIANFILSFKLFNVTNPQQPTLLSEYSIPRSDQGGESAGYFFYGIALTEELACAFGAGLYLMDISDPTTPHRVGK